MSNLLMIPGKVGSVQELKFTASGTELLGFSVACDVGFGEKRTTLWTSCTIWGKRAQALAPYIKKGGSVTVWGEASLREWKSDTKSGTSLELNVSEIVLQGGGEGKGSQPDSQEQAQGGFRRDKPAPIPGGFEDSDTPF